MRGSGRRETSRGVREKGDEPWCAGEGGWAMGYLNSSRLATCRSLCLGYRLDVRGGLLGPLGQQFERLVTL